MQRYENRLKYRHQSMLDFLYIFYISYSSISESERKKLFMKLLMVSIGRILQIAHAAAQVFAHGAPGGANESSLWSAQTECPAAP